LAVNNLNLNIANLLTNKGKIQANQTLTLNAKTLDNQQNIVANSINLTISTKTTNTGKIQTTQDLNLATNELDKLTMMLWLLFACSVPALVIRLVLVLSALSRLLQPKHCYYRFISS
jgi:adhesin HecA-like repeat protein